MSEEEHRSEEIVDAGNTQPPIPVATVESNEGGVVTRLAGSYMWLLTLICLVVAIGLVWWSMPQQGITIVIHFPEGHGLEAEDSVRYRGIEVGDVEAVELNPDLSGVDVTVNLKSFAEALARDGTRFWIVRPELSLSQVSGLETAVGHKYIAALPQGEAGERKTLFDGLPVAPPDLSNQGGIEIILRGEQRFGVTPGSPVHFRGVVVGRVLSVELAKNSQHVDCRVRIFQPYQDFVSNQSRFWSSSGVDFDLKWGSGLKVDIESLETVVSGGISFLTIQAGGEPIRPGQLFTLYSEPEEDWIAQANQTSMTDAVNLRAAVPMAIRWDQSGLFGTSTKRASFVGTLLASGDQRRLIVPVDMLMPPAKAKEGTFQVSIFNAPSPLKFLVPDSEEPVTAIEISEASVPDGNNNAFTPSECRVASEPESCLAVRREGVDDPAIYFHLPIAADDLKSDWQLKNFDGDRDVWHGAPVVAEADGKLLGVLLVGDDGAQVVLWQEDWFDAP